MSTSNTIAPVPVARSTWTCSPSLAFLVRDEGTFMMEGPTRASELVLLGDVAFLVDHATDGAHGPFDSLEAVLHLLARDFLHTDEGTLIPWGEAVYVLRPDALVRRHEAAEAVLEFAEPVFRSTFDGGFVGGCVTVYRFGEYFWVSGDGRDVPRVEEHHPSFEAAWRDYWRDLVLPAGSSVRTSLFTADEVVERFRPWNPQPDGDRTVTINGQLRQLRAHPTPETPMS